MDKVDFVNDLLEMYPAKNEGFWRDTYLKNLPLNIDYGKLWDLVIREYGFKSNPDLKFLFDRLDKCRVYKQEDNELIDIRINGKEFPGKKFDYDYLFSVTKQEITDLKAKNIKFTIVKKEVDY